MNKTITAVLRDVIPVSPIFTTQAAAKTAGVHPDVASRDLARVATQGLLTRVTAGVWADPRHPDFSPYAVVPFLLQVRGSAIPGYVSLLSALNLRGVIQQIPRVIQIVTPRRRSTVRTPLGTYEFHQIDAELFGGFKPFGQLANFNMATPAKALFDVIYLSARRGRRFSHLPEIELPRDFRMAELEHWIKSIRYPPLRSAVVRRWNTLRLAQSLAIA